MKEMAIHVDGKYDYKFKIIRAVYYLSYKDAVMKKVEYIYQEGSPARAQLYSLYLALQHLTASLIICVLTSSFIVL